LARRFFGGCEIGFFHMSGLFVQQDSLLLALMEIRR
jgi:hypothetical protein